MSKTITITKAKLKYSKKGDISLEVSYEETIEGGSRTVNQVCNVQPHDDLLSAFRKLDEHLAGLCEQNNKEGKPDAEHTRARGYTLKDEDDENKDGITITGMRELSTGKMITLNSPFATWNALGENYPFAQQLDRSILKCSEEVREYLFNGKHAPDEQGQLFPETPETEEVK